MVMMVLVLTKLVTRTRLIKWRSYAIVGAFIIGMLLAPPDVLSQTLLAIPIWLLYEAGIFLSRFVKVSKEDKK
jgi:sec-independent protein translocase protein TatC